MSISAIADARRKIKNAELLEIEGIFKLSNSNTNYINCVQVAKCV
jgi:hypothetical protein